MTTPTSVMTRLDAVNSLLASIGQSPINTLVSPIPKDAAQAEITIDTVLREVLTLGWSFNTDKDYTLIPDGNNNILVPANAMFLDPESQAKDYVIRYENGVAKLYDRDTNSFNIESKVDCRIVWAFEFEEIPQPVRQYVTARAGRIFQSQIVGSQILYQYTAELEAEAYANFKRMERRQKKHNMIANTAIANRLYNPTR